MKFIPILFSTPMVQAILGGSKTQTRRTKGLEKFNIAPDLFINNNRIVDTCRFWDESIEQDPNPLKREFIIESSDGYQNKVQCPYGKGGDILWVREGYCPGYFDDGKNGYKADWNKTAAEYVSEPKWKPSIHMPKSACRIFLKVKSVHPERLHQISDDDCLKEGIIDYNDGTYKNYFTKKGFREQDGVECLLPRASFQSLWCSINGLKSWENNPWVWVVEFERITLNLSEMNLFLNNTINQK